jgi:hypothetical protein
MNRGNGCLRRQSSLMKQRPSPDAQQERHDGEARKPATFHEVLSRLCRSATKPKTSSDMADRHPRRLSSASFSKAVQVMNGSLFPPYTESMDDHVLAIA